MAERDAAVAEALAALLDRALQGDEDLAAVASAWPGLDEAGRADLLRLLARLRGAAPTPPAPVPPRERFGAFRLLQPLGEGGMGVVWLAAQEPLGRTVALKLIRPERGGSRTARQRLLREAQAIGRLRHDHVVGVLAAGEEEGQPWIAMEHVPGAGLDELLRSWNARPEERAPADTIVRWGRDLARALHAAHEAGIVHRDVKPSNVRVTPEGRAMLLDFGLARDATAAALTMTGEFQGSPHYASPEQVRARPEGVDARTDVYSLGATLYECLTGRVPFTGETAEQIFHQILEREPLAPRALAPHLSRDLETVLLKALEKEPARRYASAAAFADDLDAVLGHRPVAARPVGTWTRAAKWARRNPNGALAAGLALLLVGGLPSAFAVVQTRSAAKVRRERDASDGIRLASQSALALPTDPGLALILARESHARSASVFSRSALFAALEACRESRTFAGHASSGTAVAWGPDGASVLSASQAGDLTRWSAADGGVLGRWPHPAAVWEIVVLPDGSGIFTACADGRIRRYGWDDADPALEIAAHRRSVLGLVRHPRDGRLLSRSADATACVFDPATGAELLRVGEPGRSTVSSAEFHPSRNEFLTGSYDGTVRVWDGASGAELARMSGADREIRWAVWSPDGERILAADIGGSAWLWNASDGAVLRAWQQIQHAVDGGFAADGTVLLTTAADRLERIALGRDEALESWSLGEAIASIRPLETGGHLIGLASGDLWWLDAAGQIAGPLLGHSAVLIAGAFQAQGSRLATTATDGTVRIWEPRRPGLRRTILRAPATIRGLVWSGDGRTLVVALESGEILRAEAPDFVPHAAFLAPEGFNSNLLASTARHALRSSWSNRTHSGRLAWLDCDEGRELWHLDSATMGLAAPDFERGLLVAHRGRGRLEAFDLATGTPLRELAGSDANPVRAAACAGGGAAAALLRDGTVQVVDVGDGAVRAEFPPGAEPRQEVSISRDGGTVAWSSQDGWLEVMDVAGGSRLARIRAIGLREHRFTGDGALLLAPADELWVWRRGMARPEPLGKVYNISSHATSADPAGRWISSGDSDGRLHLWRQSDLVEELVVDGWPSQFNAHALAPDGARAAVACGTRLDVVEIADLPELAERRVPRAATAAERERYGLRD